MRRQSWMQSLSRALSILVVVAALGQPSDAMAGDYTVSYAFDATTEPDVVAAEKSSLNEQGTINDCRYAAFCSIKLSKSDLSVQLEVRRTKRDQSEIVVYVDGGRPHSIGCCYFNDGQSRFSCDLREPLVRLNVYDGHGRRGNEFIRNLHLGVLYLQFSDLK